MKKLLVILLLAALLCMAGCAPGEPATTDPLYHILPYPLPFTTTTQMPSEPKDVKVDWTMDTKMVHRDGQIIGNGTMIMEGSIIKQEDANDLLLLNLTLPNTVQYRFTDHTQDDEGFFIMETELPYYVSMGYCYSILENAPVFSHFALDAEMGYLIIEWENLPGQYLIASRDGDADPATILAHFQDFIDTYSFNS